MVRLLKKIDKFVSDSGSKNDNEFDYENLMLELRQLHLSTLETLHSVVELDLEQGFDYIKEKDKVFFEEFCYVQKKVRELLKELDSKNY